MYILKCDANATSCFLVDEDARLTPLQNAILRLYLYAVIGIILITVCTPSRPHVVVYGSERAAPHEKIDHHVLHDKPSGCKD